jgi:hypothetical protein
MHFSVRHLPGEARVEEFLALHKYLAFFFAIHRLKEAFFFLFLEVLQRALKVQGDAQGRIRSHRRNLCNYPPVCGDPSCPFERAAVSSHSAHS